MLTKNRKKVVVIGGGTGTAMVISGLKLFPVDISAIISVADSGGSTGKLRDEFGFLPVGDLRQALSALATGVDQTWIRELLLYRFSKGSGLEGHNLGNLILTALQDMSGSTAKAMDIASFIFRLDGHIYPSTTHAVDLVVEYTDGTFVIGEHHLNPHNSGGRKIKRVRLSPRTTLYPQAKVALRQANGIIIGPGDLYASLIPNLVVTGIKPTFKNLTAPIIYVVNLMSSYTQTHNLTAHDHLHEIELAIGRHVDFVVINNQPIPDSIKKAYYIQHEFPVVDDLGNDTRVVRASLIITTPVKPQVGDTITRSYLRHDPQALARSINSLLNL